MKQLTAKTILLYGDEQYFLTDSDESIQESIADLYEYLGGALDADLFRSMVCKLECADAAKLFDALAFEPPLIAIYTDCACEYEGVE